MKQETPAPFLSTVTLRATNGLVYTLNPTDLGGLILTPGGMPSSPNPVLVSPSGYFWQLGLNPQGQMTVTQVFYPDPIHPANPYLVIFPSSGGLYWNLTVSDLGALNVSLGSSPYS